MLTSSQGTGATVHEFINQPNGTLKVTLTPDDESDATVTITGPCWLEESVIVAVAGTAPTEPSHRRRTSTPTATATPTQAPPTEAPPPATVPPPTATPSGGAGPVVVPPVTGSGPSDGDLPWVATGLLLAGSVAAAAGLLRLRRSARR